MKNDDDFLSDLESDIDGDWQDIRRKILKEQAEKYTLDNPQRIDIPRYEVFYEILYNIFRSWDGSTNLDPHVLEDLHVLIRNIFYEQGSNNKMPKAFERVWEIFCSPREFKCDTGVRCNHCKQRWDVLYKVEKVVIRAVPPWEDEYNAHMMEIRQSRVNCPSCGYNILNLSNVTLVGVFGHVHVNEKEEYNPRGERGNDKVFKWELDF